MLFFFSGFLGLAKETLELLSDVAETLKLVSHPISHPFQLGTCSLGLVQHVRPPTFDVLLHHAEISGSRSATIDVFHASLHLALVVAHVSGSGHLGLQVVLVGLGLFDSLVGLLLQLCLPTLPLLQLLSLFLQSLLLLQAPLLLKLLQVLVLADFDGLVLVNVDESSHAHSAAHVLVVVHLLAVALVALVVNVTQLSVVVIAVGVASELVSFALVFRAFAFHGVSVNHGLGQDLRVIFLLAKEVIKLLILVLQSSSTLLVAKLRFPLLVLLDLLENIRLALLLGDKGGVLAEPLNQAHVDGIFRWLLWLAQFNLLVNDQLHFHELTDCQLLTSAKLHVRFR